MKSSIYEVVIAGGSYAGLSAALALGRARREVLMIDAGVPCNRQTPHSHNFLSRDGIQPAELASIGLEEVLRYPSITYQNGFVNSITRGEHYLELALADKQQVLAKKVLLATGIKDLLPAIPGFEACWGISVLHCPYCHGYEVSKLPTALLANGEMAFHLGMLLTQWTQDLVLLSNGPHMLHPEQLQRLQSNGVSIIETPIKQLLHENGQLRQIHLQDGQVLERTVMYSRAPFKQHLEGAWELTEQGYIRVDESLSTSIAGIYAAGDNSNPMRSVAMAVFTGSKAGAMINAALVFES